MFTSINSRTPSGTSSADRKSLSEHCLYQAVAHFGEKCGLVGNSRCHERAAASKQSTLGSVSRRQVKTPDPIPFACAMPGPLSDSIPSRRWFSIVSLELTEENLVVVLALENHLSCKQSTNFQLGCASFRPHTSIDAYPLSAVH
jgi:hypothetical protein